MATASNEYVRHISQAALVERFDSVLFPFDVEHLLERLPELGWLVPSRRRNEETGFVSLTDVPSKGNVRMQLNMGNKAIGVLANDLSEMMDRYNELWQAIRDSSEFAPEVRTDYVEFRYVGWIKNGSRPVDVLSTWWSDSSRASNLGRFLVSQLHLDATEMGQYGIRFAPVHEDANRPNWAELTVTPSNASGTQWYYFDLIFRNEDVELVKEVAKTADELVDSVLHRLETGSDD